MKVECEKSFRLFFFRWYRRLNYLTNHFYFVISANQDGSKVTSEILLAVLFIMLVSIVVEPALLGFYLFTFVV